MEIVQGALALFIIALLPLIGHGKLAELRRRPEENLRIAVYRRAALSLWTATVAAFVLGNGWQLFLMRLPAGDAWLTGYRTLTSMAVIAVCAFFVIAAGQGLLCLCNAARRRQAAPALAALRFLLPVSRTGRRWWIMLSLTAGICEELLYRGYLLHFLLGALELSLPAAWLVGALAFGLAHLYQGWRGILASATMGLVFGLLAIGTGSLFVPMILHAVLDLQVLWMYRPDLDGEPEASPPQSTTNFSA